MMKPNYMNASEKKFYEEFAKDWEKVCFAVKKRFGEKLKNMKIVAYNSEGTRLSKGEQK